MIVDIHTVKEHCENLDNKGKQELYRRVLQEAKNAIDSNDIDQLKKLSEVAVVIEEVSKLKPFDDENPLREANIVVESNGLTNYLFSLGNSSKLYDLRENQEEALYQAIKSDDVELVKHLLMVLLPGDCKEVSINYLKELEILLSKPYKELQRDLSQDMINYLEKEIKFYSFLRDFKSGENDPIKVFAIQANVDYQIDKLLHSFIARNVEDERLLSEVNHMIELLEKYEKFNELEYKVRRLKSELESGKSKYPTEVIQASIEEREKEMRENRENYIKPVDLVDERKRLVKHMYLEGS